MEFSIKFDTVKAGRSNVYIEGSQVVHVFLSLNVIFIFANNSADPVEMPPSATFHLGLHCLPKYLFMGVQSLMG